MHYCTHLPEKKNNLCPLCAKFNVVIQPLLYQSLNNPYIWYSLDERNPSDPSETKLYVRQIIDILHNTVYGLYSINKIGDIFYKYKLIINNAFIYNYYARNNDEVINLILDYGNFNSSTKTAIIQKYDLYNCKIQEYSIINPSEKEHPLLFMPSNFYGI